MTGETDRPHDDAQAYEVTFTNAINGYFVRRRYGSREEADHAAMTERPFNNTRTEVQSVGAGTTDKEGPVADQTESLPHEPYLELVGDALFKLGYTAPLFTSTPDGEQLDAWFDFDDDELDSDQWPDGVYLGWDQRDGWVLTSTGVNRNTWPLDVLDSYARPEDVAAVAHARLIDAPFPGVTPWERAAEIEVAVKAWEADHG